MRYHLTLVRMAIIKKIRGKKCWKGWREMGTLIIHWWEYKFVPTKFVFTKKTIQKFLKKLKVDQLYDPAIPFLSIYPKEMKTGYQINALPCLLQHNSH